MFYRKLCTVMIWTHYVFSYLKYSYYLEFPMTLNSIFISLSFNPYIPIFTCFWYNYCLVNVFGNYDSPSVLKNINNVGILDGLTFLKIKEDVFFFCEHQCPISSLKQSGAMKNENQDMLFQAFASILRLQYFVCEQKFSQDMEVNVNFLLTLSHNHSVQSSLK